MSETMQITVLAFGSAASAFGWHSKNVALQSDSTLGRLIAELEKECPRLAAAAGRIKYAVNQAYATPDTLLKPGDEVAVIPPVSGGGVPSARLVREPIDVHALMREAESPAAGGIAIFIGAVRYEMDAQHRGLKALEYSAYDAMALAEMGRLCDDAYRRFNLVKAVLVHRLGLMKICEASVAVVVSAAHRAEAFDACRFIIDELKKTVPIFKKDVWHDGRGEWHDPI